MYRASTRPEYDLILAVPIGFGHSKLSASGSCSGSASWKIDRVRAKIENYPRNVMWILGYDRITRDWYVRCMRNNQHRNQLPVTFLIFQSIRVCGRQWEQFLRSPIMHIDLREYELRNSFFCHFWQGLCNGPSSGIINSRNNLTISLFSLW